MSAWPEIGHYEALRASGPEEPRAPEGVKSALAFCPIFWEVGAEPSMARRIVSSLFLALVVAASAGACSNEGEGQPCSTLNGNNDCDDGLQCVAPPGGMNATNAPEVCCPVPPAQPTTPECSTPSFTLGDSSTAAPDGHADGASDASSDVSSDTASEGAADAASDGSSSDGAASEGAATDATGQ